MSRDSREIWLKKEVRKMLVEAVAQAIDDLDETKLEEALSDFLVEQQLVPVFLVWLEK